MVGVAFVLGVLSLPPVHWSLLGCIRGEPFYRGRPASYWRADIMACEPHMGFVCFLVDGSRFPPQTLTVDWIRRLSRPTLLVLQWVQRWDVEKLGEFLDPPPPMQECDPSAVPVLMALLGDPDPNVRYFAVQKLANLGGAARPALPILRGMAGDRAEIAPAIELTPAPTVAAVVRDALRRIDPDTSTPETQP
jgi:hypothetical protein